MIAVVTYRFLGKEEHIHIKTREQYDEVMEMLLNNSWTQDLHVYECVEIEVGALAS